MRERYILNIDENMRPRFISVVDPTEDTKRIWEIFKEMNELKKNIIPLSEVQEPITLLKRFTFPKNERIDELEREIEIIQENL